MRILFNRRPTDFGDLPEDLQLVLSDAFAGELMSVKSVDFVPAHKMLVRLTDDVRELIAPSVISPNAKIEVDGKLVRLDELPLDKFVAVRSFIEHYGILPRYIEGDDDMAAGIYREDGSDAIDEPFVLPEVAVGDRIEDVIATAAENPESAVHGESALVRMFQATASSVNSPSTAIDMVFAARYYQMYGRLPPPEREPEDDEHVCICGKVGQGVCLVRPAEPEVH